MISKIEKIVRQAQLSISRNQWLVRALGLSVAQQASSGERQRGLIIIQIDGLARRQLEQALAEKSMPFVKKLLDKEQYQLHSLYSGQPSSTPAAQGELFYGVKGCVPAFSFKRHDDQRTVIMLEPNAAATVEAKLMEDGGQPLLRDGSAFSNIFTGGAKESSFCASSLGWSSIMPTNNPLKIAVFALLNLPSIVRVLFLMVVELGLAIVDCLRGLIDGRDLYQELKFVPTRVATCALMRELVTIGVSLDAIRGMPIVHANFIGYDEQAHRRGPSSSFAHWSLKGIDWAIHRIWYAAKRSQYRDYDLWICSDHGQEAVVSYPKVAEHSIQSAVERAFSHQLKQTQAATISDLSQQQLNRIQSRRANWLGFPGFSEDPSDEEPITLNTGEVGMPQVVAMGPLGFVYLPKALSQAEKMRMAQALAGENDIPIVMLVNENPTAGSQVLAWSKGGRFELPKDAATLLGKDHPFLEEIGQDLAALVQHPDSGDLVISGWRSHEPPLSFRVENGAHAGPGVNETHAFALLPGDTPLASTHKNYIRFLSLREAALRLLGRQDHIEAELKQQHQVQAKKPKPLAVISNAKRPEHAHCLRVLTYNIHRCTGMDGLVSAARIVRVIAQYQPDVVALQELDVDLVSTDQIDQAKLIADELRMGLNLHPVTHMQQGRFGNAILTHLPMRRIKAGPLSAPDSTRKGLSGRPPFNEPRGAIWVELDFNGQPVNLITTHLGLSPKERREQVTTLLSEDWLNSPDCSGPTILCGDFNATPSQQAMQRLSSRLSNAQTDLYGKAVKKTFAGRYPTMCIDHVLSDASITVKNVMVAKGSLAKVASDHLPLIVDLEIKSGG